MPLATVFFCYLLKSNATENSKSSYIGFSTCPARRLQQHNGELVSGAYRTNRHRPWIHVAIVSGFPNKIVALQFEWQWQHPYKSRVIRNSFVNKSKSSRISGYKARLEVLHKLLCTPLWQQLRLTVNLLDIKFLNLWESLGVCASKVQLISKRDVDLMKSMPERVILEHPSYCRVCLKQYPIVDTNNNCDANGINSCIVWWRCSRCMVNVHIMCLAKESFEHNIGESDTLIPSIGRCRSCGNIQPWKEIVVNAFTTNKGGDLSSLNFIVLDNEDDDDDNDDKNSVESDSNYISSSDNESESKK
eukprot:gene8153-11034_t